MRHAALPLLVAGLLLAAPAGAFGPPERACARAARSVESVERLEAFFARMPGPFARFLEGWAEIALQRVARGYADRCVAMNQVQVLGSHNSYHIEPPQFLIDIFQFFDPRAIQWQYTHRPLPEQFGLLGIRQIELDVYADPDGGLYASPIGYQILQNDPQARIPEMEAPGIKVFHVQEFDWQTTCRFFTECLAQVKAWSDANPGHLPIAILVEVKDEPLDAPIAVPDPVPFDAAAFDALEADILSVFPLGQIVTPDDVRGGAATLEDAVLSRGWPRLGQARGRVVFALDNRGKRGVYTAGSPSLEGRLLFTDARPGEPDAAFVKQNGPLGNVAAIQDLVAAGYVVRTRADADTIQARLDDPTQRDAALASAAHWVSTDYAEPDLRFSGYQVQIPGDAPWRCNPVNAPPGCRDFALEP